MIDREIQLITSPYGPRGTIFHRGVDLRTREEGTYKKQAVVAPEKIKIARVVYQVEWGFTIVADAIESGGQLKFIHVAPLKGVVKGAGFMAGEIIAEAAVTPYMRDHKYFEHLHFERWVNDEPIDPIIYFNERGIKYDYK